MQTLYSKLTDEDKEYFDRRIRRGDGEYISITYKEEVPVAGGKAGKTTYQTVEDKMYVGEMTMGQSGQIIAVLAVLASDGIKMKEAFGRKDNIIFLELLGESRVAGLFRAITQQPFEWLLDNYSLTRWGIRALKAFLSYNDFLSLIQQVQDLASTLGVSPEAAKLLALGQSEASKETIAKVAEAEAETQVELPQDTKPE